MGNYSILQSVLTFVYLFFRLGSSRKCNIKYLIVSRRINQSQRNFKRQDSRVSIVLWMCNSFCFLVHT